MPVEIKMPQHTDTMTEGTVVKWRMKEGERVKLGETVAEIETDKAVMEMEASNAGTLAAVLVPEGQKVPVGETLAVLAVGGGNPADVKKQFASGRGGAAAAATSNAPAAAAKAPQGQPAGAGAGAGVGVAAGPRPVRVPPQPASGVQSGSSHTLDGGSRGRVPEPAEAGHGATRGPATAVPPVQHGGNGNGERV